jgi:hypothetical protein
LTFARASNVLKKILANLSGPLTPQNIREQIKKDYSEYYRTPADIRNVAKGYYKDLDHDTLAQIYNRVGNNKSFTCDKTKTPMEISLSGNEKAPDDNDINELNNPQRQFILLNQTKGKYIKTR